MTSKSDNVLIHLALGIPDRTTVIPKTTTGKPTFDVQPT